MRITQKVLDSTLENLTLELIQAGVPQATANMLEVSNPYGPRGLHLVERDPSNGAISTNTIVGSYYWTGPKQAHRELMAIWRGVRAGRTAAMNREPANG